MNLATKQAKIQLRRAQNKQIKEFIVEKWNKRDQECVLEKKNIFHLLIRISN